MWTIFRYDQGMSREELEELPAEARDVILADGWIEERREVRDGVLVLERIVHPPDGHAALRQAERLLHDGLSAPPV